MQCSQETIARLFYNVSSSFFLFLLLFYFTSILLSKFFQFFGTPIFQRNQDDGYEFNMLSEEEDEEEEETEDDKSYFHGGRGSDVEMMIKETTHDSDDASSSTVDNPPDFHDHDHDHDHDLEPYEAFLSPASSESKQAPDDDDDEEEEEEEAENNNEIPSCDSHADVIPWPTQNHHHHHHKTHQQPQPENRFINYHEQEEESEKQRTEIKNSNNGGGTPTNTESRKLRWKEEEGGGGDNGVVFGDACTVGSISRDSSEWRDSSYTEDPFSSSSRRSCFKWESYPIFQKYQDEMLLFDKIIWEKLQESETLKFIQSRPKSMSKRIVHIFIPGTKQSSSSTTNYHRRHYHELESAYVAQICLTWEALSWNYNYFCRLKASRRDADPGCPAYVAQQFQQFQVLLQRYNETEPYERGKRPEIYTRKRISSPKLLQVPEYRDSNDEERESSSSRIPSKSFLVIMEESIKTFMDFLKADKQSRISKVVSFEKSKIRTDHHHPTDPTRILLLKKVNKKKKRKVKEIRRGGHRWTFKKTTRECKGEEEMEILMSLIDLKVVERVLRMGYEFEYLDEEKLQWCEEKMMKVRLLQNGKVKRDSSTSPPLLFPATVHHNQH